MNIILYEILISLSTGLMYFLTAAGMSDCGTGHDGHQLRSGTVLHAPAR